MHKLFLYDQIEGSYPVWVLLGRGEEATLGKVNQWYWHRRGRLIGLRTSCAIILTSSNYSHATDAIDNELRLLRDDYEAWRLANGHGPVPKSKAEKAFEELARNA